MHNIKKLLVLAEYYDKYDKYKEADLLTKEAETLLGNTVNKILAIPSVRNFVKNYVIELGIPLLVDAAAIGISGGTAAAAAPSIHATVTAILNTPLSLIGKTGAYDGGTEKTVGDYVANRTISYMQETMQEESLPTQIREALQNREGNENYIGTIIEVVKRELGRHTQLIKDIFLEDLNLVEIIKQKLNIEQAEETNASAEINVPEEPNEPIDTNAEVVE